MKKYPLEPAVALYCTEQIKNIERRFAEQSSAGSYSLMEKAGAVAFQQLTANWREARKILVVTGKGNNAGDGFVLVKLAAEQRFKVYLCHLADPDELTGDALKAYQQIPHRVVDKTNIDEVTLSQFDVIVDAMLGTGIQGKLREPYLSTIKRINANKVPVLSIDIPTGVEANTGFVHNEAVRANITTTFVGHKKGLYTGDAASYRGRVKLFTLGIPERFYEKHEFHLFSQNWFSLKHLLKPRAITCHKGLFGHTIVIGGFEGMSGAAILASTAAARCGSGLTSAWVGEQCAASLVNHTPEVMARSVDQSDIHSLVSTQLSSTKTLVVGPGLGQSSWASTWLEAISKDDNGKSNAQVWDADALNWLAAQPASHKNKYNAARILTPHPGEAARLLGITTDSVNQDRYLAAQKIAEVYGGVCVLKGAGTIVADDKGFQVVCPVGNPGMASGGMGDVLAGITGALLAQKFSLMNAAILAVCIHGEAADKAAGKGEFYRGLLASDLFEHLPALLNPY
jgi:hydroxyethylthiazole kinase-like uncharacterized protein yjeF